MRKILDVLCFVVGAFLITFFLFGWENGVLGRMWYDNNPRIGLAIGVSLVCLGFLIRSWEKDGEK